MHTCQWYIDILQAIAQIIIRYNDIFYTFDLVERVEII
jgi:hypothetical protein